MTNKLATILALSFLVTSCGENTQNQKKPSKTGASAMGVESLTNNIKTLSSDDFGGRAPGTVGEEKTLAFLQAAYKEAGLVPVAGESYLQKVPLVSIDTKDNASLSFVDGSGQSIDVEYVKDHVVWTRRLVEASHIQDSELVFVGYGINAPERGWNDYEGIDVKGKTVVMLVNDPGYATQDPNIFNGNAMTYYGRWSYKFDEAAKQGASGAIIIHDTKPASYPFTVVQSGWTGKKLYMERSDKGMGLIQIESWITYDVAEKLFKHSGLSLDEMKKAAATKGFKAVPMSIKATASVENIIGRTHSYNVAGLLKGSEKADEAFVYMAHWDHLGIDEKAEGDKIHNGAIDNASGTAGMLELAKAFASLETKPKRSILFLAVTAEEQGKLGSAYYAANPLLPLSKTVGGINIDGLNNFGKTNDIVVIGHGNSELDNYLEAAAEKSGRYLRPDPEPEKGYFYRSDHFEFSKRGVPTLFPGNGIDHIEKGEAYGKAMGDLYTKEHYHQPSDEYNDQWILDGAMADLELYYDMGYAIANSQDWPAWFEGTEFKAVREKQMAENQ